MKQSIIILFFIVSAYFNAIAQLRTDKEKLDYYLKRMHLNLRVPKGFEQDHRPDSGHFPGRGSTPLNSATYKVKQTDRDVLIAFSLVDTDTTGSKLRYYDYDDGNQMKIIRSLALIPIADEERDGVYNMNLDKEKVVIPSVLVAI